MLLKPTRVSSKSFSYTLYDRTFTAFASDLGPGFRFGRVYDDACDEGLTLVSHTTGIEVVFRIENVHTEEGDILSWELVSVTPTYKGRYSMIIFND